MKHPFFEGYRRGKESEIRLKEPQAKGRDADVKPRDTEVKVRETEARAKGKRKDEEASDSNSTH